jgi:uncharacterized protein (DUF488 family)
MHKLYTIGYSCHSIKSLTKALKTYNVEAVADVRSQPFSKFKPEFNRPNLSTELKRQRLKYVFLGEECGARIDDPNCYVNGKADYSLIATNKLFQKGLERIERGLSKLNIALLCAEKDPITCHRTILICHNLKERVSNIEHILCDNTLETHEHVELRLKMKHNLDIPDMFMNEEQLLEQAYFLQSQEIAYDLNTVKKKGSVYYE